MEINYDYLHNALDRVEHTSTIDAFYRQFQVIQSLLSFIHPEIPEIYFASRFVYGLQADYQNFIFRFKPITVLASYRLASIYEESIYLDYFPELPMQYDKLEDELNVVENSMDVHKGEEAKTIILNGEFTTANGVVFHSSEGGSADVYLGQEFVDSIGEDTILGIDSISICVDKDNQVGEGFSLACPTAELEEVLDDNGSDDLSHSDKGSQHCLLSTTKDFRKNDTGIFLQLGYGTHSGSSCSSDAMTVVVSFSQHLTFKWEPGPSNRCVEMAHMTDLDARLVSNPFLYQLIVNSFHVSSHCAIRSYCTAVAELILGRPPDIHFGCIIQKLEPVRICGISYHALWGHTPLSNHNATYVVTFLTAKSMLVTLINSDQRGSRHIFFHELVIFQQYLILAGYPKSVRVLSEPIHGLKMAVHGYPLANLAVRPRGNYILALSICSSSSTPIFLDISTPTLKQMLVSSQKRALQYVVESDFRTNAPCRHKFAPSVKVLNLFGRSWAGVCENSSVRKVKYGCFLDFVGVSSSKIYHRSGLTVPRNSHDIPSIGNLHSLSQRLIQGWSITGMR